MKSKILLPEQSAVQILHLSRLSRRYENATVILRTGYLSLFLPQFVASLDREWLADTCTDAHLYPDGTFDNHNTVSPFLKAAMVHQGHRHYLSLKKSHVFIVPRMLIVWRCYMSWF